MTKELPEYRTTLVYGNLLIAGPVGASNMIHYGGDSGVPRSTARARCTSTTTPSSCAPTETVRTRDTARRCSTPTRQTRRSTRGTTSSLCGPATQGSPPTELAWMRDEGNLKLGVNWAIAGHVRSGATTSPRRRRDHRPRQGDRRQGQRPWFHRRGRRRLHASRPAPRRPAWPRHCTRCRSRSARPLTSNTCTRRRAGSVPPATRPGRVLRIGGRRRTASSTARPGQRVASSPRATSAPAAGRAPPFRDRRSRTVGGPAPVPRQGPQRLRQRAEVCVHRRRRGSPSVICVRAGASGGGTARPRLRSARSTPAIAAAAPRRRHPGRGGHLSRERGRRQVRARWSRHEVTLLGGFSPDFATPGRLQVPFGDRRQGQRGPAVQLHLESGGKTVLDGFRITGGRGLGTTRGRRTGAAAASSSSSSATARC